MTDRPIIFSAPMIRALIDGRKTQTRLVLKPQPFLSDGLWFLTSGPEALGIYETEAEMLADVPIFRRPKYAPGDCLWVREAFRGDKGYDAYPPREWSHWPVHYEADENRDGREGMGADGKPRPSTHMPRWASRLTLVVTDVRVQRIGEISLGDCWAEGCETDRHLMGGHVIPKGTTLPFKEFRDLWNSIYGPDAWYENPWVAALTFDVHRCNIDQMEDAA